MSAIYKFLLVSLYLLALLSCGKGEVVDVSTNEKALHDYNIASTKFNFEASEIIRDELEIYLRNLSSSLSLSGPTISSSTENVSSSTGNSTNSFSSAISSSFAHLSSQGPGSSSSSTPISTTFLITTRNARMFPTQDTAALMAAGDTIVIMASPPPSGLCFLGWNTTPQALSTNLSVLAPGSARLIMPTASVTVSATMGACQSSSLSSSVSSSSAPPQHSLLIESGIITGSGLSSGLFAAGSQVSLTATPPSGHCFVSWETSITANLSNPLLITTILTMPAGSLSVSARTALCPSSSSAISSAVISSSQPASSITPSSSSISSGTPSSSSIATMRTVTITNGVLRTAPHNDLAQGNYPVGQRNISIEATIPAGRCFVTWMRVPTTLLLLNNNSPTSNIMEMPNENVFLEAITQSCVSSSVPSSSSIAISSSVAVSSSSLAISSSVAVSSSSLAVSSSGVISSSSGVCPPGQCVGNPLVVVADGSVNINETGVFIQFGSASHTHMQLNHTGSQFQISLEKCGILATMSAPNWSHQFTGMGTNCGNNIWIIRRIGGNANSVQIQNSW